MTRFIITALYILTCIILGIYVVLATLNVSLWTFMLAGMYGALANMAALVPLGVYYFITKKPLTHKTNNMEELSMFLRRQAE